MFCSQCGVENLSTATHCRNCGIDLAANAAPAAAGAEPKAERLAIWNPNATVNWSLIFTPAFGAYLQMLNWRALGESGKATWSRIWFYASLGMLALYVYMAAFADDPLAEDKMARGLGFSFLLVWYFSFGKTQSLYVKKKLGKRYAKKSWGRPLLVGVGGVMGFYLAAALAGHVTRLVG
jgi:hypothetical protein